MATQFVIYKDSEDKWRWRLFGANNSDIVADSGQGYTTRKNCLNGIRIVMNVTSATPVYDHTKDYATVDPSEIARSGS